MCYIFYALALGVGLVFPIIFATNMMGLGIGIFFDLISFIMVVCGSYLLVSTAAGQLLFYQNDKYLKMWGDLGLKMGYIGTVLGFVLILASMVNPPEGGVVLTAKLGASLAIALLTLLYGLTFKYMVIAPWLGCRESCKESSNNK